MKIVSGVYEIRNMLNNHRYIGSSVNIHKRFAEHKAALKSNRHANGYLQKAWNKYGDEFEFKILKECHVDDLLFFEQWYIDNSNPEYNICKIAGNTLGRKLSDEAKAKIGYANSKRIIKESTRRKHAINTKKSEWNKKQRKSVIMVDSSTMKEMKTFASIMEAAEFLGHVNKRVSIKRCLQGKYHTAYGYFWKLNINNNDI